MAKKTTSKKESWLYWIKQIKVEDLLIIVFGILAFMIIILISHYSQPGETFPYNMSIVSYLIYIKKTSFKYVFFVLIPLLTVWVAKLFQKKTWNYKKTIAWLVIGVAVVLLIYFIIPSTNGFENIPKAEKPTVKVFVMSFCPFGQKAEEALKPVQDLFKDKVIIEPHFIINDLSYRPEVSRSGCIKNNTLCSLHGIGELYENMRQMCIWKYYQGQWWDYALCINSNCKKDDVESCWQGCAENNEISVAKIRACQELEGIVMAEKDRNLSDELKAYSSPTILINNEIYQGEERTSEILKQAICKGFEEPPGECQIKISENINLTGSSKEKAAEGIIIKSTIDANKCTEEGVCPTTGEKTIPNTINKTG